MSQDAIKARAEELAAEWLRDPAHLEHIATTDCDTDCDIWPALVNALRKCGEDTEDAIHSLRYIQLMLVREAAPQFLEQAEREDREIRASNAVDSAIDKAQEPGGRFGHD